MDRQSANGVAWVDIQTDLSKCYIIRMELFFKRAGIFGKEYATEKLFVCC